MRQCLGEGGLGAEGEEVCGIDDLARRALVDQEDSHRFLGKFMGVEQPDRRLAIGPQRLLRPVFDLDRFLEIDLVQYLRSRDRGRPIGLARQGFGLSRELVEIEGFGRRKLER